MTAFAPVAFPAGSKLFCFGYGYCAETLATHLANFAPSFACAGTQRAAPNSAQQRRSIVQFDGQSASNHAAASLEGSTHVLLSIPPDIDGDPALRWHGPDLAQQKSLCWIGYLSTVGVYGDAQGNWVDETTPPAPISERGARRLLAEEQWRAFGRKHGKRVEIFRLPGIYGPGRSAFDSLRNGTARRIVKPGQVFNRVHVADIAMALTLAMAAASAGRKIGSDTFNVTDDEPAPPQDVIAHAAQLIGISPPPEITFETARLTPMAASFYAESKRVSNHRLKSVFGLSLAYPTYRQGLAAILNAERP